MSARLALASLIVGAACASARAGETTDEWIRWSHDRAESLERQGYIEDSIEEWTSLAQLRPGDVEPLAHAAVLAVELPVFNGQELRTGSREFQIADQCVRLAVLRRGGQGDPALAYAIGRMRYAEKNWTTSWKTLAQAKDGGFDPVRSRYWYYRAAVNHAADLIEKGHSADVLDELKALRKSQPGHPDEHSLLVDLAAAHNGVQEPQEATKILLDEIQRNPTAADALYLLAKILADEGRLDEAALRYREALLHPSSTPGDKTYHNALLRLTETYIKLNKLDDAEATAKQALAFSKDEPDALYVLGRVKQAQNDYQAAVQIFRRVVRMQPDSMDGLVNLKQVLHQLGFEEEAIEVGKELDALQKKREKLLMGAPGTMDAQPPK